MNILPRVHQTGSKKQFFRNYGGLERDRCRLHFSNKGLTGLILPVIKLSRFYVTCVSCATANELGSEIFPDADSQHLYELALNTEGMSTLSMNQG
jgi:hypothetical protein